VTVMDLRKACSVCKAESCWPPARFLLTQTLHRSIVAATREDGMNEDIIVLSAVRTAIGSFGGALAGIPPTELATVAARGALGKAGLDPSLIGHVMFGHVINTEPQDMYLSRVAAMRAGVPETTPAMNLDRLCGSGVQAVVSAVQALRLGDADFALAGGAECMSRSPFIVPDQRWGAKMGDIRTLDMMLGALNCPFGTGHMGVTAENVAKEYGISREVQDAFALQSQQRAAVAQQEGRFDGQIIPVEVPARRGTVVFRRMSTRNQPPQKGLQRCALSFRKTEP